MQIYEVAAVVFAAMTVLTVGFQWALGFGAPWGHLAMGGKYPGRLPLPVRGAVLLQSLLLVFLAILVLARAQVAFEVLAEIADIGAWVAVGVSAVSLILNLITPSKPERRLWAPVTVLMLVCAVIVAVA